MTSLTLFWFLCCQLSEDLAHSAGVSVDGYEWVNAGSVDEL